MTEEGRLEKRIVDKLLTDALAQGFNVTVMDGEDYPIERSTDKAAITAAMFATDMDTLTFLRADMSMVGIAVLIYGNGRDVIFDYSDNHAMGHLIRGCEVVV